MGSLLKNRLHGFLQLFTDPRILTLLAAAALVVASVLLLGTVLLLLIVSLMLTFALESYISALTKRGFPTVLARNSVFFIFLIIYCVALIGPVQLAVEQILQLTTRIPEIVDELAAHVEDWQLPVFLQMYFPGISEIFADNKNISEILQKNLTEYTQHFIQKAFSAISGITGAIIYLILTPLLVFFLLQDKSALSKSAGRLLPGDLQLVKRIWGEMEERMAKYVRSKVGEILIVGIVTWVVFAILQFEYAVLMGVFTGLSVLVPYVGAFVLTLPIFLLGLAQWGFSWQLTSLLIAYLIIQFLDGNVLVPLMFSEAVKITPTAILIGVIVFGRLWGFWGAVFAIPLLALFKAFALTWFEFRHPVKE